MSPSSNTIWLLLALSTCWSSALKLPSIAEVDLLFPRNDTYAPTVLMPLVFAFQDDSLVEVFLNLNIQWVLYQYTDDTTTLKDSGIVFGTPFIPVGPGPYYEYTGFCNLMEGTWELNWLLDSVNCTSLSTDSPPLWPYGQFGSIVFTIRNNTQAADLVAATADNVCADADGITFNVTGVVPALVENGQVENCAVLESTLSTPSPNPCAAQLNATAASSIMAALTSSMCTPPSSLVSSTAHSSGSKKVLLEGSIWMVAISGWLLYTIIG